MAALNSPGDQDKITNSDESKKLPDDTPEPLADGMKTDDLDTEPEGTISEGNVAAKNEEDTRKLDGSNANNLRTK